MGSCASLETGNPPRNGATRNFEYINAFYCWCPPSTSLLQERPSSQFQREVPFPDGERNVHLSGEVYLMGSGVPRNMYTTAHSHGPRHRNQLVQAVSLPRARQTCLQSGAPGNQIGASGPCSFRSTSVAVHITNPNVCESLACVTRCIRFSWPIAGATHKSCGILTSSLAHSREAMKCAYKLHLMDRSRTFMVPRSHFSQKRRRC
jgi:hypothetical protein